MKNKIINFTIHGIIFYNLVTHQCYLFKGKTKIILEIAHMK